MVGVPFFFWCVSGVSSRTLLCPCWLKRSCAMNRGPTSMPSSSAATPAATMRKVG